MLAWDFLRWFSGGQHQYMRLYHCMNMDMPWIAITVGLDAAVAVGYILIARHWWKNERVMPAAPAKNALRGMRNIFIFCGVCGYVFIPVKLVWPAWRLYDLFMAGLAYFTWKYALRARDLKVVYSELGRSRQLAEDLEQSRAESRRKTAFLNALSHDLRTPLNALLLQTEVARLGINERDLQTIQTAVSEIDDSARATANLLESLLQCAKLDWATEPNDLSVFLLDSVLEHVIATCRRAANAKQISLELSGPASPKLRTDQHKLERILLNLVDNAVKFTTVGGVRIITECMRDNIEIHIIDTGIGMNAEEVSCLFEEFYQAGNHERDRNKGFGLGLAIARRLARQLGGDLAVQSARGAGSCFTVALSGVVVPGCDSQDDGPKLASEALVVQGNGSGR